MTKTFLIASGQAVLILCFVMSLLIGVARAQDVGLGDGGDGLPIQIDADGGLEWREGFSVVTARGNATATRGDVQVRADALSAYYREDQTNATEVWRLEAVGDVQITAPGRSAVAERGTYDVDRAILVLDGNSGVRLAGEEGEITADGQVEYWENEKMVVARGNAHARQGDRGLRADVLVAYLASDDGGKSRLERVEAFDEVSVYTPGEEARADRGTYTADTGLATLLGSVKIKRGKNQLEGCRAEVDLQAGISKLFGCANGVDSRQVRGLLRPEKDTEDKLRQ